MKKRMVPSELLLVLFLIVTTNEEELPSETQYSNWICKDKLCQKAQSLEDSTASTLDTCNMLCYDIPPLWPKPKMINIINKNSSTFLKEHIFLKIHSPPSVKIELEEAANMFLDNLIEPTGKQHEYHLYEGEHEIVKLNLHITEADLKISTTTNESYTLYSQRLFDSIVVNIIANNYFGARHGLETLSQLIWYDQFLRRFRIIHDVKIVDEPSFNHRGLLIDVSRHYFPIELLKKAIDGMAASKLNVLHFHLSDSTSFPLILPHNKQLALNGAYGDVLKYSPSDIKELVEYARKRGIRTIMEIDAPSHVTPQAWPKDQVLCSDNIFDSTLNPDNPETFNTLQSIYSDLFNLGTDTETFHIGDDEVITDCWRETESAQKENFDIYSVWTKFTNQMIERVKLANNETLPKNIVLWSSPLTDKHLMSLSNKSNLVVQYWLGQFTHILEHGYKIIFSTVGQWYLDCGFGPWKKDQRNGACDPYTDWRKFYKYRPWKDYPKNLDQVLGGEVCLWTEQVSPDDMETRLWPRSSAFAERAWSDPPGFEEDDVFRRIDFFSRRLTQRGLRVAAIWPQICSLYPEKC